jgi:hypothetical protein
LLAEIYEKFLTIKSERKQPHWRVRHRLDDNKWITPKQGMRCGLESVAQERFPVASSCEQGNESSESIKRMAYFDQLCALIFFSQNILF